MSWNFRTRMDFESSYDLLTRPWPLFDLTYRYIQLWINKGPQKVFSARSCQGFLLSEINVFGKQLIMPQSIESPMGLESPWKARKFSIDFIVASFYYNTTFFTKKKNLVSKYTNIKYPHKKGKRIRFLACGKLFFVMKALKTAVFKPLKTVNFLKFFEKSS